MRRRTWILLAATLITVVGALAIGEGVARASVSSRLAESAPDGVAVAPAGLVLWGLVSGSMPVTLTVDADTLQRAIAGNLPEGQEDADIRDIRIDEYIYIDLVRESPIGEVPIEVAVRPAVSDGTLTTQIVSVTASGFELPVSVLDGVSLSPGSGLVNSGCLALRDARVEDDTVVLTADARRGC
ncbi:hypothetical protein [Microbacterium sp.]|uniref:hypothetical protein n=1 Tax=Microbacterium sp. TaxID=51671 RepID=UPI0025CF6127|nr:hypothetical protein [Microbacterium sp.]